jgi:hypothetical protein
MATNLLFIGELDIHERDFLPFLAAHGYNVTVINTSCPEFPRTTTGTDIPVYNLYENNRIRFVFKDSVGRAWILKAASGGLLERVGFTFDKVGQILKKKEIDVIYGSWGSIGLPELRFIKKFDVPIIYEFLTYPVGFTKIVEKVENVLNRSIINALAGRIFASPRMLNYMENTFDLQHGSNIVFTESYSRKCFFQKRLPRLSDKDGEPHLVFLGLDSYEIFPQIEEMLRRGIHIHICENIALEQRVRLSWYRDFCHVFKRTSGSALFDGSFATFRTQFDACLVTYDLNKSTSARLCNSIPNRFSFNIPAGIPFVMPQGYMKSCEDIVNRHGIGFAYTNYDDLKNNLSNKDLMNYYQHNASEKSSIFTLENNFEKIDKFLKKIANS